MELWDVYDMNRQLTGRKMARGERRVPGDYHQVVHVCLINSKGQMLIQQRTKDKDSYPGLWDVSVGGSVLYGETVSEAAARELMEEVGIRRDFTGVLPQVSFYDKYGFDDIFVVSGEADVSELRLQPEEVEQVRWASEDEILEMIENGSFIDYLPEYIRLVFRICDSYGNKID